MDTLAGPLDLMLDPVMVIAAVAVALAVRAMIHDRRGAKRKRTNPRVITLSNHLRAYRPNQRIAGEGKTTL